MYYDQLETPLGPLIAVMDADGLWRIEFLNGRRSCLILPGWVQDSERLRPVLQELQEYCAGQRRKFGVPIMFRGSEFQNRVWQELTRIPYGQTISYAELARRIGRPRAVRAVGAANARNPLPIIVPCHRVVGSDGSLTGYSGGISIKAALLELEARQM